MTFTEAAEQILKRAGRPLHYREILKLALAEGLVETEGQTPEATMGAMLYVAVRRDEEAGRPARFRAEGRGRFSLVEASDASDLERRVAEQNTRVAQELLEFLRSMHPRQLEFIVGQLLGAIGFEAVQVTRYVGDDGIDVEAVLTVGGVTRVRTAVQVKRYKESNRVQAAPIRELRGSLTTEQRGLIITTSAYSSGAVEEASAPGKTPISLIDGDRLVELLIQHKIGVQHRDLRAYELDLEHLVTIEDEETDSSRSAVIWPLPGGQDSFLQTLTAFLKKIGADKPSLEDMAKWVIANYERVTKQNLVRSYLRAVLYSLDLIKFDGNRVLLTDNGAKWLADPTPAHMLRILRENILGIDELLDLGKAGPFATEDALEHLKRTINVSWETDAQTKYRLQWLAAAGAIERTGKKWALVAND